MKRIGSFSLAIIIFTLSIVLFLPDISFADDDKTVLSFTFKQLNHSVGAGMSASDASAVVKAHKDIYTSDGKLLFIYNPSNSYNWTTSTEAYYLTLNYSDEQLKNIFMSKNPLSTIFNVWGAGLSNNNGIRAFCAGLGAIYSGNSDMGTKVLDTLSGNYNYLDALSYDEDSQTITMSNDNGSVDKLREEIKEYYYRSVGIRFLKSSGDIKNAISTSYYDDMDLYTEDFKMLTDYDYAIFSKSWKVLFAFNKSDLNYLYCTQKYYNDSSSTVDVVIRNVDKNLDDIDLNISSSFNITPDNFSPYTIKSFGVYGNLYSVSTSSLNFLNVAFDGVFGSDSKPDYFAAECYLFSKNDQDIMFFASYESLYNYLKSDQNAYLSKTINETGKDITYSIKDMDENLGSKMDTLIDTINDKKGSMSQEELQDAIDKGLEELNKNTEDIKDNTSSILDKLEEQNQILLQILGVTEFIAYQEVKENSDQYNMSYLKTLLDSMFTGLFNALMYGENTVDDNNTDTASIQSFSVSNAAAPVAPYSDDIVVYDSSGSGGGSSFGGGSGSSGGHTFNLKKGLFGKFPFSIPYQCYNWLQILQRDPEAPTFTLDYGYLFGAAGAPEYVLTFDLSRYNDIAEVGRSFCRLFMTLMLALGIYHKNKGEM